MTDIEATRQLTRGEAADYLREFADQLDDRDSDPLSAGLYDADGSTGTTDQSTDATTDQSTDATTDSSSEGTMAPSSTAAASDSSTTDQSSTDGGETRETEQSLDDPATGADRRVTFLVGNDSATVNPPQEIGFAVEVGNDDSLVSSDSEQHVTFDLTWHAQDVDDPDTLDIE